MSDLVRFSVSLEANLLERFDRFCDAGRFATRSEGIRQLPFDEEHFRAETGASALGGETGRSTLERIWTRPTCEINGLLSGYTGEGAKTVLPAKAMAKVSCRLVPDQDPREIARLVDAHVQRVKPAGVTATVTELHGGRPWRADGHPASFLQRPASCRRFPRWRYSSS